MNKWTETDRELLSKIDPSGFRAIASAVVTEKEQEWGISRSICLTMKAGGQKYLSLSRDSELQDGDEVDLKSIEVITLERDGDEPIYRVDGKKMAIEDVNSAVARHEDNNISKSKESSDKNKKEEKSSHKWSFWIVFIFLLCGIPNALSNESNVKTFGTLFIVIGCIVIAYYVAKSLSDSD